MKKWVLIYGLIFFATGFLAAQDGVNLEALKIAYLTKRMNLTTDEAQRFWPIYNQYTEELKLVRQDGKQRGVPEIQMEEEVLNIRKKYNAEFNKALPPDKVNRFFQSEKEFGNFVQRERQRRQLMMMQQRRPLMR